jgi:uncharacterized protein YkwD
MARDYLRRITSMACVPVIAALAASLGMSGCNPSTQSSGQPAFYRSVASPTATVDAEAARATISAYRLNKGLGTFVTDPVLQAAALREAQAMAAADKPASADVVLRSLTAAGMKKEALGANLSAGYHTLAEAFSGWRDSPQHNAVMLKPGATRMGIATAYSPGSKYKVYWALVVAAP